MIVWFLEIKLPQRHPAREGDETAVGVFQSIHRLSRLSPRPQLSAVQLEQSRGPGLASSLLETFSFHISRYLLHRHVYRPDPPTVHTTEGHQVHPGVQHGDAELPADLLGLLNGNLDGKVGGCQVHLNCVLCAGIAETDRRIL